MSLFRRKSAGVQEESIPVDAVRSLSRPKAVLVQSRKVIEFHSDAAFDFLWLHRKPVGILLIVTIVMSVLLVGRTTRASVSLFYPSSCLGGWQGPMHAAGIPGDKADTSQYTADNSAVLSNSQGDLFCGTFVGTKVENTNPTHLALVLDLAIGEQPQAAGDVIPVAAPEAPAAPASESTVETPVSNDTPTTTPEAPVESPAPAPESMTPSIFGLGALVAHAEEVSAESASTTASPEAPDADTTNSSVPVSENSADTAAVAAPMLADGLLQVAYSLDGTTWTPLGTVTDISNHAPSFIFPDEVLSDWSTLDKLQVKISPVLSINAPSKVYVRNIRAEVSYVTREEAKTADLNERSDQKHYSISAIDLKTEHVLLSIQKDPDQGDILVVRTSGQGALYIYDKDGALVTNTGVGEDGLPFPAYNFTPGDFTIVYTTQPTGCDALILDACLKAKGFVEAAHFTVVATADTPLDARSDEPASPDNLILPPIDTPPLGGEVVHVFSSLAPITKIEEVQKDAEPLPVTTNTQETSVFENLTPPPDASVIDVSESPSIPLVDSTQSP
jgi:hypothetical protein